MNLFRLAECYLLFDEGAQSLHECALHFAQARNARVVSFLRLRVVVRMLNYVSTHQVFYANSQGRPAESRLRLAKRLPTVQISGQSLSLRRENRRRLVQVCGPYKLLNWAQSVDFDCRFSRLRYWGTLLGGNR